MMKAMGEVSSQENLGKLFDLKSKNGTSAREHQYASQPRITQVPDNGSQTEKLTLSHSKKKVRKGINLLEAQNY